MRRLLGLEKDEFLQNVYGKISFFLQSLVHIVPTLQEHLNSEDIVIMKDNMYTFDRWVFTTAMDYLVEEEVMFSETYGDMSILGIFAGMRETLFGFLLRYTFIQQEADAAEVEVHLQALKRIYIVDVLNLSQYYVGIFSMLIDHLHTQYHDLLRARVGLDDNEEYFRIGL